MSMIPQHVPESLVRDFDYIAETSGKSDPHAELMKVAQSDWPEIFYTPRNGGHWVVRSYEIVQEVLRDHERFTTTPVQIPPMEGQPAKMVPIEIDPPEHSRFRKIMGPLFTPAAIKRVEEKVRQTAIELIEPLRGQSEVDFVHAFAHRFPPLVFLRSMGMPTDRVEEFVEWATVALVGARDEQAQAAGSIIGFVTEFVDFKYADPSGEDWGSMLVNARDSDGNPALTRDEVIAITWFLFLAGLDTVLNTLSHAWRYFAAHPEVQERLANDFSAIPSAVEELLRFNTITNNSRRPRADFEFHGVALKAGDPVLTLLTVANRDPAQFPDSGTVDLDRENNLHLTFGMGIHRCIGSNLARAELRISIEEWLSRMPRFHLKPDSKIVSIGGTTMGLVSLPLVMETHP